VGCAGWRRSPGWCCSIGAGHVSLCALFAATFPDAVTAPPGEVLVSSTVKNLVVGSGLRFRDRGSHALKGVRDDWHLNALDADL
jgi:hypothetical protein